MVCVFNTVETGYRYIAALGGDTLLLQCKASKSGARWTHRPPDENRIYEYINGSMQGRPNTKGRYSIVNSSSDEHSLQIYNTYPADSGRYDCYDSGNARRFVYELNVTGMFTSSKSVNCTCQQYQ